MGKLLERIILVVDLEKVVYFTNDEIVIDVTDMEKGVVDRIQEEAEGNEINFRVEQFKLYDINGTEGFIKVLKDGRTEFKCLDSLMYPFVIREFNNEEVREEDKIFYHEGILAKIIEVPKIEVNLDCERQLD